MRFAVLRDVMRCNMTFGWNILPPTFTVVRGNSADGGSALHGKVVKSLPHRTASQSRRFKSEIDGLEKVVISPGTLSSRWYPTTVQ
jgi:hypothetical protein